MSKFEPFKVPATLMWTSYDKRPTDVALGLRKRIQTTVAGILGRNYRKPTVDELVLPEKLPVQNDKYGVRSSVYKAPSTTLVYSSIKEFYNSK